MTVPGISNPLSASPAAAAKARGKGSKAPAPAPAPAPTGGTSTDGVALSGRAPLSVDTGKLFESGPRKPVLPAQVATWHYEAEDKHSIEEIFRNPDGRTYVVANSFDTSRDRHKAPGSYTAAFDPQGQPLWTYRPKGGHQIKSHLFRSDGTTLVVSRGEGSWDGSRLVCLNDHGVERWAYDSPSREHIDSIRTGPDGTVYVKQGDDLVALSADGEKLWSRSIGIHSDEFFHVSGPDGTQIFAGDNFSNNFGYDMFRAVSPKGRPKDLDLPDIGTFPLEVGSRLVYGGEKGEVHGIDLGSKGRWEVQTDSVRGLKTPWLGRDGNVYVEGRFDDKLYALSPDGRLLWSRTIEDAAPGGFDTPFHVDADGSVYYMLEKSNEIQQILPDGKPGRRINGGESLEHFRPGGDGNLYTWGRDGSLGVRSTDGARAWTLPVEIENATVWDLEDVLPGGIVVLQKMDEVYHLQPSQDRELKEALEQVLKGPGPEPGKEIEPEEGWIRIGDVRLPVRG